MKLFNELKNLDSSEISDALDACGIEGALLNIKPLGHGIKLVGPAYTVQYHPYKEKPKEFKGASDYIDNVPANHVIVLDNQNREDCTCWGNILTQFALIKNIAGTVINGAVRDINFIKNVNYPVFCRNVYMRSAKNRAYKVAEQTTIKIQNVLVNPGDIIFGDDQGVLVIPQSCIDRVIEKAKNIRITEKKIIHAITQEKMRLCDARQQLRYDQPWLKSRGGEKMC